MLLAVDRSRRRETLVVRCLRRIYEPALEFALANRIVTLAALALLVLAGGRLRCARSGSSSCRSSRKATSGSARPCRTSISLEEGNTYVNRMRKLIDELSRRSRPSSRSTAGPTTAPTPPASSTPSSSCR